MSRQDRIILSHISLRYPCLESVYRVLQSEVLSFDSLTNLFAMPEQGKIGFQTDQLRQCLSFLRILNIVEKEETSEKENYRLAPGSSDQTFRLLLLTKLKSTKDNSFYLVHRHLVLDDIVKVDLSTLKRKVEKDIELDFAWTDEKLNFWIELAHYLGLGLKYFSTRTFVSYPTNELLWELMKQFSRKKNNLIYLTDLINYISATYFECVTKHGRLYRGFEDSLMLLQEKGNVTLYPATSDEKNPVLVKDRPIGYLEIKEDL